MLREVRPGCLTLPLFKKTLISDFATLFKGNPTLYPLYGSNGLVRDCFLFQCAVHWQTDNKSARDEVSVI